MINDLISRSVAIRICEKAMDLCAGYPGVSMLVAVKDAIEHAPADQPEIIRCKDCRHNGSFDTDCPIDWNGKEYCSFAER